MNKTIQVFTITFLSITFSFANLFFSEYAEGSSNNKYLEIYNATSESIDLTQYAYPSTANDPEVPGEYEYWNEFEPGASVAPGDVYVICHGSADEFILGECDEYHTYLSNGDDGYCLVFGGESNYDFIDCIGDWNADPGSGWDVAGVSSGTKDHTLVRKQTVSSGNNGDWSSSAGTNSDDSEWHVLDQNDWTYLGSHPHDIDGGGADDGGDTGGTGGSGLCAEYGCGEYIPDNPCQCNDLCVSYENCCSDFIDVCGEPELETEICDDGIDNDGDGFIDCDDWGCSGGPDGDEEIDPACQGDDGSDGGSNSEICDDEIDNDGDGFIDCDDFDCGYIDGCGGEICDDGQDNDDDTYIDCNDFDCSNDPACENDGTGSCAEYGCVGYTPANACQCNDLCVEYDNCCDDYEELCADSGSDGGSGSEICDDGIDNDGDGYIDCDDYNCDGTFGELDPACSGSDGGGSDGGSEPVDEDNVFFSEYAEGSSNNKYLEIFNADDHDVDLGLYSLSSCANGCNDGSSWDYPNNVEFSLGTMLSPGEVYVVCHGSADASILSECDQFHTYLSNGDDTYGLTQVSTGAVIDIIGTIGDDPGNGWDVAGVTDATKDHTLVRKSSVSGGNYGDWAGSAGTNTDNSEWEVYDQNTWDYVGYHDQGCNSTFGCTDETAFNYDPCAEINDGTCIYQEDVTIYQIQGSSNSSPYSGFPISTNGIVTGVNYAGFYMQDPMGGEWSGIWVYAQGLENFGTIQVGDEVTVTGIVEEFYDLTEIESDGVTVLSSGNMLPEPVVLSTGGLGEAHEGVLVKFDNAICLSDVNDYGEWEADDGSGALLVDDKLMSYEPVIGQSYNIVGIGDFGFDVYRLQATAVDFPEGYPVADAGADQTVDYGDTVVLDGSSSYDTDGSIIGFQWTQVSGDNVAIADLETDVITFIAPSEFTILTFALQVFDNDNNTSTDFVSVFVGEQSIYDIQYSEEAGGTDDCYPSQLTGEIINIGGIVTAVKSFSSYPNFFIQDPTLNEWGGVYVYVGEMDALSVGDEVNFNAEIEEYYGVTELTGITDLQLLSSNNTPVATSISTGDLGLGCGVGEMYEGMFVEFSNITVESIDDQYSSIYINDGTGTAKLDDYFFNFDAGDWPNLSPGDTIESARGVVHYYFGEYVVYPRDLNDMDGQEGGGGGPVSTSIYDIQYSSNIGSGEDCYPSSISGQSVNVSGIVTAVQSFSSNPNFFIQDPSLSEWSGVYVYVPGTEPLTVGDNVNFNAEVEEYYGVTELKNVSDVEVLSTGNSVTAVSINSGDLGIDCGPGEMYEGMFVSLSNLYVETFDSQYGSIYVNDGSGTAKLDDYFFNFNGDDGELLGYWPELSTGDTIDSVQGVVHYYFGDYVIYPRNINDFNSEGDSCSATGDINGDGMINVVDIVNLVGFVLETAIPTADQECASDMNGDGTLNVVDIVVLVNMILG